MKIKYAKEAVSDLIRLRAFIEAKNPEAAARISRELLNGIKNLSQFPEIGVGVEQAPDSKIMRDFYIMDYHVRYLVLQNTLFILRIWHQKENR